MAFDIAKFIGRFADEAREHIGKLNEGLVALEKNPDDAETINAIFRSAHTIKGSSRMLKLAQISEVAHKLEDALGALREKTIVYSTELADVLFKATDVIADMIEKTAAGQEITADNSLLCEELAKVAEGAVSPVTSGQKGEAEENAGLNTHETVTMPAEGPSPAEAKAPVPSESAPPDIRQQEVERAGVKSAHSNKTLATVRISADKLDELIKLMGELVSNQNRLKQALRDIKATGRAAKKNLELVLKRKKENNGIFPDAVVNSAQSLFAELNQLLSGMRDYNNIQELLTDELQTNALRMRMVPLSTVFDSLPRMVRDIARSIGKETEIVTEGGDIELDKKMIEKIGDPLVHMIRNAIDHGIEAPEERIKSGKPARGTIRVSASYDAGSVLIVIADDGSGIPLERIKEKALRKKMYSEDELAAMSESAVIDMIFQPGFSTSAIITDVSGRGVGMDVVKRNIVEELRGAVSIESKAGKGTAFNVRLPMTLAVMRILLIGVSGMTFGIMTNYVTEIVRVAESDFKQVVDKKAITLRNEFVSVAGLDNLLNVPGPAGRAQEPLIIIVRIGSENIGLIVDTLLDEEDMVIKSLPPHMKNIHLVSGVALSGKNEIISILHVPGLMEAAKEVSGEGKGARAVKEEEKGLRVLVVDDSVNTREIEKSILEAYGYNVELAEDGMEALEKAREFKYDIIITDVEMPRLDGFSLTEKLRKEENYRDTPIIIVTSREKDEDKKRGIRVGANAYIVKGTFDQSNLLETMQNLMG
ncbi:MAG: hybrid sensor histidine kinase/response regulator [Nitrospirae bacterium]|nr:hybrid sensor histidine kinase/response regulator [Nitrospirota bacterium]